MNSVASIPGSTDQPAKVSLVRPLHEPSSAGVDAVIQEKFYLCLHSLKAFPDLQYEVLQQASGKLFLVVSRHRECVAYTCSAGVDIVVKPARIVVDETGTSSLQVLYRCVETVDSPSGLFDLMKKLSAVGGYCLCSGLGDDYAFRPPADDPDVNCQYPFPRAESSSCLRWFQPKRRGLARCPECTKWVKTRKCRMTMQMKRNGPPASAAAEPTQPHRPSKTTEGPAANEDLNKAVLPPDTLASNANNTGVITQTSLPGSSPQPNLRRPLCSLSADDLRTRCRLLQSTIYKQRRSLKRLKLKLLKSKVPYTDEDEDFDGAELDTEVDDISLSPTMLSPREDLKNELGASSALPIVHS